MDCIKNHLNFHLAHSNLVAKNQDQGEDLRNILEKAYGWGIKNNRYLDVYFWRGKIVRIGLDYESGDVTTYLISSNKYDKEIAKLRKESEKRAVGDL